MTGAMPCEVCGRKAAWLHTKCTGGHAHICCLPCTRTLIHQHSPRVIRCLDTLSEADQVLIALRKDKG